MRLSPRPGLWRAACSFGFVLGCVLLAGCSRGEGALSGKVTYKGVPLKGGNVSLVSTDGGNSYAGVVGEDGTYSIPKVTTGAFKVCVETDSLKPSPAGAGVKGSGPSGAPKNSGPPPGANVPEGYSASDPASAAAASKAKRYTQIPDKYGKAETTDLTFEVKGGDNKFDIDLK